MANFINKKYSETITNLIDGMNDRLKNPFYIHNDKQPPTPVDYYNQSAMKTSLDENLIQEYKDLGEDSPIRFNKIEDFMLYGMQRLEVSYNITENGLESETLQGEAIILPNTFIPKKGDFFRVRYIKQPLLFKVVSSTIDTIDNLNNFYRIQWVYERPDLEDLEKQVVENFVAVVENVGTEFKSIIKKSEYKFIEKIDETLVKLKEYFKILFYSDRVQTFIFPYNTNLFYDPYAVEFIMKHNLISTSEEYIFVTQQIALHKTFPLEYDKSIFKAIEKQDKKIGKYYGSSQAEFIQDAFGVFSFRSEPYYKLIYREYKFPNLDIIQFMDEDLVSRIENNKLYDEDELNYRNIIIKYLNNDSVNVSDINYMENIQYTDNKFLFYEILFIIYILEKSVKILLG